MILIFWSILSSDGVATINHQSTTRVLSRGGGPQTGSKSFNAVHKDAVVILEVETEGEGIMQPSAPPPSIKDSASSGGGDTV